MSDGTLTKSATKIVLFRYSKYTYLGAGVEPVRCFVTPPICSFIFVILFTKFQNFFGFLLQSNFVFLLLILPDQMSDSIKFCFYISRKKVSRSILI